MENGLGNPEFLSGKWNYSSGELEIINGILARSMAKEGVRNIRHKLFNINKQMGRFYPQDIEQIARAEEYPFVLVAMPLHTMPNNYMAVRLETLEGRVEYPYVVWVLEFDPQEATAVDIVAGAVSGIAFEDGVSSEVVYEQNLLRLADAGLAMQCEDMRINTYSLN